MWQYGVLFGFQPIVVLFFFFEFHLRARWGTEPYVALL